MIDKYDILLIMFLITGWLIITVSLFPDWNQFLIEHTNCGILHTNTNQTQPMHWGCK